MDQLKCSPIVLKGYSPSSNSLIAMKLANMLKYPLINEDDITQPLGNSLPTSSTEIKNLAFKVLCQVVSTQLKLEISVIINTSLCRGTYLERWVQLASTFGFHISIIKGQEQKDQRIDHAPELLVITKSLDRTKVESAVNSVVLSTKVRDNTSSSSNVSFKPSTKQDKVLRECESTRTLINDHLHELTFSDKPRKDELACKRCSELVSDLNYQCIECDEFILHKSCAESPDNINVLERSCPLYLREIRPKYDFPTKHGCNNCDQFFDGCYDCLLQTNLHHGFLPSIINYNKQHRHPLNLIIMPLEYNYLYQCCSCGKFGNSVSYKCYDCYYDVHVNCIFCPATVTFKNDKHSLSLTYSSSQDDSDEYTCDICNKKGDRSQWFYQCGDGDCDLAVHIKCMPNLSHSTTAY